MKTRETKIIRGVIGWTIDGKTFTHERTVTTITDVRDTVIGPIDFGYVMLGAQRVVQI